MMSIKDNKDAINPDYYKGNGKIETTKYILSHKLNFCEGNIIKYITRYKLKNGLEDLLKAKKYLALLIEDVEKNNVWYTPFYNYDIPNGNIPSIVYGLWR